LDTDISTVYSAVNGIANGTNSLANVSITGGGIDNVTIGATTAANGTFSNLTATTSRVGNVATGTWNASTIDVAHGGTGLTSTPANGALDIGNGTGFTRTTLTAGSNITITNGAGSITIASTGGGGGGSGTVTSINVSGGTTGLTTSGGPVTTSGTITMAGTLVVGNGGTGATTLTANSVVLGNGTGVVQVVTPGTSGNVLTSNGITWISTAPTSGSGVANVQSFTTSGTWTKPSGYAAGSRVMIQAWGGGGSGAKGASNGGAGGGGYNERWVTLSAMGATETITIGAGGTAVTVNGVGNTGGTTSVGSLCSAYGGGPGSGSTFGYGGAQLAGGAPWASLVTGVVWDGWNWGGYGGTTAQSGNTSGSSVWGGGAGGFSTITTAGTSSFAGAGGAGGTTGSGAAGTAPSGGGGGTATGASSGAGGAGQVIITVFPA
jgi:hypothetical protein